MGLFQTREPRQYRKVSIYTSERKDKLDKLVRDIKRQQGELPADDVDPDKFKGKFSQFTPHAQRASGGPRLTWPLVLILVVVLIFVWHYLLTGKVSF
ncbi:MAG: hypothetical protein HUK02_03310 [Bacteroidaceae bacterium]|nr:hypothetical protein [Bacteroidaceae bacterium]